MSKKRSVGMRPSDDARTRRFTPVQKSTKKRRWAARFFGSLAVLFLIAIIGGSWFVVSAMKIDQWKTFDPQKLTNWQQTTLVYDRNGQNVASVYGSQNRVAVDIQTLPDHVKYAFIAAEDVRFFDHQGLDMIRIAGALLADLKAGKFVQGASTITQQLVKLTHLTSEKTWTRKLQEAVLSIQLERNYDKNDILEMYLNTVYFGRGAYGIEAAAQSFYGISATKLTLAQAASLAAAIKGPSNFAPHTNPTRNKTRRDYIITTMRDNGFVSTAAAEEALALPIRILDKSETENYQYGWYMDYALAEAQALLGISSEEFLSGGYRVYTALDPLLQNTAQSTFQNDEFFPANASDGTEAQGAMVAMDTNTGEILALVGGRDYTVRKGFNRATQARRQPGSSFKPLAVFAPAISRGTAPATIMLDERADFNGYSPRNSSNKYYGYVTLRTALAKSLNTVAVRLLQKTGLNAAFDYLSSVGIDLPESDRNLSTALGGITYGVTPLELCAAYVPFANGGDYIKPYTVLSILDASGEPLYTAQKESSKVLAADAAYIMTSMMQSVVSEGTGTRLSGLGFNVAAKTGTVTYKNSGTQDAWMAAYTPQIAVTAWLGFDETSDVHHLPSSVSGANYPTLWVKEMLTAYHSQTPAETFQKPDTVVEANIDARVLFATHDIVLASDATPKDSILKELFLAGFAPTTSSATNSLPQAVGNFAVTFDEELRPVISFSANGENTRFRIMREGSTGIDTLGVYEAVGQVSYTDLTAQPEQTYTYWIVPYNTLLEDAGLPAAGENSTPITITVPAKVPESTPEPTPEPTPESTSNFWDFLWGNPTPAPEETPLPEQTPVVVG